MPCPDRIYSRLPSVPIQILTRRGLPVLRPSVVSWTSRSRAAASSTSALNGLIRSLWRGERRDPPGASGRVLRGATACRDAVSIAILHEPLARDRIPLPIPSTPPAPTSGGVPPRCAQGSRDDRGPRDA